MTRPRIHLVDLNSDVADALVGAFARFPEVEVQVGDLLGLAFDTVVSPANSNGFMDGGIDDAYRRAFGSRFESAVRDRLLSLPHGLPVGIALVLRVDHPRILRVVLAPTMEMPDMVPPINARRSFAAALRAAHAAGSLDVFCPGLCTGVGLVEPSEAAAQMVAAYERWTEEARQPRLAKGQPFGLRRNDPVPEYLCSTFDLLTAAYPEGMSSEHQDYLALLTVLRESDMSFRNIATAMSCSFDLDYSLVINEVYRIDTEPEPILDQDRVISRLQRFGFDQWRSEP